jgi:hypothetical protein
MAFAPRIGSFGKKRGGENGCSIGIELYAVAQQFENSHKTRRAIQLAEQMSC